MSIDEIKYKIEELEHLKKTACFLDESCAIADQIKELKDQLPKEINDPEPDCSDEGCIMCGS